MATGKMMGGGQNELKWYGEACMRSDLINNDVNTKVVKIFKGFPNGASLTPSNFLVRLKNAKYSKKHGAFEIWRGRLKEVCSLLTILRGKSKLNPQQRVILIGVCVAGWSCAANSLNNGNVIFLGGGASGYLRGRLIGRGRSIMTFCRTSNVGGFGGVAAFSASSCGPQEFIFPPSNQFTSQDTLHKGRGSPAAAPAQFGSCATGMYLPLHEFLRDVGRTNILMYLKIEVVTMYDNVRFIVRPDVGRTKKQHRASYLSDARTRSRTTRRLGPHRDGYGVDEGVDTDLCVHGPNHVDTPRIEEGNMIRGGSDQHFACAACGNPASILRGTPFSLPYNSGNGFGRMTRRRTQTVMYESQALAWAQAGPGQAMLEGLGLGLQNPEPEPAQAGPRPGLLAGQLAWGFESETENIQQTKPSNA
ncbi:hypothetical protein C8J57DRAFT_1253597 [Mycena rebaudengoi]|nr:hypothetical protein C8J57DRAFT_1253597 [Mycena rebaudengoi]